VFYDLKNTNCLLCLSNHDRDGMEQEEKEGKDDRDRAIMTCSALKTKSNRRLFSSLTSFPYFELFSWSICNKV